MNELLGGRELVSVSVEHTSKGRWLNVPTREVEKRPESELKSRLFLYIANQNAPFYQKPFAGWEKTQGAFPSAIYDVEEGAKCFALHRNTACVFHVMRVLELGLRSIASALGIMLRWPDRSWGKILSKVKEEVERRNKSGDPSWPPNRAFFEGAYSSLHAVKDAWRNPTMHVEKVYDSDRAEHIYQMVRAFMEQLSTGLHEQAP